MKKKINWIFVIVVLFVITILVLALTFFVDNKKDETETPDDQIENEDNSTSTPEEMYATSLTVNLPLVINILNGTTVNLLEDCVVAKPDVMQSKVKMEIKPRYNSSTFGLTLENLTLTAKEVGTYNLIISVPRSEGTTFNETILISVYTETVNAHIIQTNNKIKVGENAHIADLFSIKQDSHFAVETDNKLSFSNNTITANQIGLSTLVIKFTEGYVQYVYKFEISINPQPVYSINVNVANNIVEIDLNDTYVVFIEYEITNSESATANQDVMVTSLDENVVVIENVANPFIKLRALNVGESTIKVVCLEDHEVFVEFKVVVTE